MIAEEVINVTENFLGVGFEAEVYGVNNYIRHMAHLSADLTLCGKPLAGMLPTVDETSSSRACPLCAEVEVEETKARNRSAR